jgi:hypothetical protein
MDIDAGSAVGCTRLTITAYVQAALLREFRNSGSRLDKISVSTRIHISAHQVRDLHIMGAGGNTGTAVLAAKSDFEKVESIPLGSGGKKWPHSAIPG